MTSQQPTGKQLLSARFMPLDRVTETDEARALVDELADLTESWELSDGPRKNKRGAATQEGFTVAVAALVGDLVAGYHLGDGTEWSYVSSDKNSFKGKRVSYRHWTSVMQAWLALGLVDKHKSLMFEGGFDPVEGGFEAPGGTGPLRRYTARYRPTDKLLEMVSGLGVAEEDLDIHFKRSPELPRDPLVLKPIANSPGRQALSRTPAKTETLDFVMSEEAAAIIARINSFNEFVQSFDIQGCNPIVFRRIFHAFPRRDDTYQFNKHGRWYSVGEKGYQSLSKEERLGITINGQPVVEIDIIASHLTLLHALLKKPFDSGSDPYDVGALPRVCVKSWIVQTIGNGSPVQRWGRDTGKAFLKEGVKIRQYPARDVGDAVLQKHPVLGRTRGHTPSAHDLMFCEAQIITETLESLMSYGVPVLPIHDSLLVERKYENAVGFFLQQHAKRLYGYAPSLKVLRAPLAEQLPLHPTNPWRDEHGNKVRSFEEGIEAVERQLAL